MSYALLRLLFVACSLVLLNGCGLTGSTSGFRVEVPRAAKSAPLTLASVEIEPNQTRLVNVGSYAWGEYDGDDLAVLRSSMAESLEPLKPTPGAASHRVHVVVRRFLVSHSNSEGLALACVAWALSAPDGSIAFHEQFYASRYVRLWGTVGGIKNSVHEGIANRVLRTAARVAAGEARPAQPPEYTFDTYEAATNGLPGELTSHFSSLVLGGGYSYSVFGASGVEWARRPEHFDWTSRLARPSP